MSLIGYARVSASDQDVAPWLDALRTAGVARAFGDRGVSGAKTGRPGLTEALAFLREGGPPAVWKPSRSMTHLLQVAAGLKGWGVGFRSLTGSHGSFCRIVR